VVALLARDRGGPALAGQVLLCPMLDDRNDTPSALQMAGLGIWDRTANEAGWTALLRGFRLTLGLRERRRGPRRGHTGPHLLLRYPSDRRV
jgi:acetyl esterase/lipase